MEKTASLTSVDFEESQKYDTSKFSELLKLLNIQEVYYVDDYNKFDFFSVVSSITKKAFREGRQEELEKIYADYIDVNVPDDEILGEALATKWEELTLAEQSELTSKIFLLEGQEFNTLDSSRIKKLQESFPSGILHLINPDDWEEKFKELVVKYKTSGKVLILFDQDLTKSTGINFKNGTIKGQHLILNLKQSSIKENVYCALITHIITDTSKELDERDKIIDSLSKQLSEKDFFALTKERIKSPELLCDGIKKALLNGYCEEIKITSTRIIDEAQKKTLARIKKLDTYDFDHTILRSSYEEGVWEMNTLFRIADNIYDDEVKKEMGNSDYAKKVNPCIKQAKSISDIRFKIEPGTIPYAEKYSLRHQDIYEYGETINKLNLPLENGDIFEIIDGKNKGHYILVGQECDLMMRTAPAGTRSASTGILLKIKSYTRKEFNELNSEFLKRNKGESHFFSNRFKLDYFKDKTNDIALVKFTDTYVINLDVLDLCVFNQKGEAKLDLGVKFDIDLVSASWEQRYDKLFYILKKNADTLDKLLIQVNKLPSPEKEQIKKRISFKLEIINNELGKTDNYSTQKYDFGIQRSKRLKYAGAKYLLDRYYKHLSRTAESHDFAIDELQVNVEEITAEEISTENKAEAPIQSVSDKS